jgi:hypothetical protein
MSRYVFNCGLARIAEISSVESALSGFRHDEPFFSSKVNHCDFAINDGNFA